MATSPFLRTTFGISTASDWYQKLVWEHQQMESRGFMGDVELHYRAINFCVTAWSLVDWIWRARKTGGYSGKVSDYKNEVLARNDWMEMCRHVADATKHGGIDRNPNENLRTDVDFPFANFAFGSNEVSIPLLCKGVVEFLEAEMHSAGRLKDY